MALSIEAAFHQRVLEILQRTNAGQGPMYGENTAMGMVRDLCRALLDRDRPAPIGQAMRESVEDLKARRAERLRNTLIMHLGTDDPDKVAEWISAARTMCRHVRDTPK